MIASTYGIEHTLRDCGITAATLSKAERDELDRRGFVVASAVADEEWLASMRTAFESSMENNVEANRARSVGAKHRDCIGIDDPSIQRALVFPRVLAAVHRVIGRAFQIHTVGARDPARGFGRQGLHTDWLPRAPGEAFSGVTVAWILDGYTPENGATRFVPGSHMQAGPVPKSLANPASRHSSEVVATAPAGSVLVFNGHVWHSGTKNESGARRRTIQVQYLARDRVPPTFEPPYVPADAAPAWRYLLGR